MRAETEWRPVLSEADIRALAPGQVLVLRRHLPAVIGWAPQSSQHERDRVRLPRTDAEAVAQLEAMYNAPSARTPHATARVAVRAVVAATIGSLPPRARRWLPAQAATGAGPARTGKNPSVGGAGLQPIPPGPGDGSDGGAA